MKRLAATIAALCLVLVLYLSCWPVPIQPRAWTPPAAPALEGVYAPNTALAALERMGEGRVIAPEDVAVDAQGRMYTGGADGRMQRWEADGRGVTELANTGGIPLGLDFDAAGNLIIADADKGLLSMSPEGQLTVLSTEQGGRPFGFTDDVEVAPSGAIYFSDASSKFGQQQYMEDLMEHGPNGRLLRYDPATRATELVLDKLCFANGVAVDPAEQFVLVVETGKYRVLRHWLAGPRQGETEPLIENLPGFPDGVSRGTNGIFWIALASPRDAVLDRLLPRPGLRKVVARLPKFLQPGIQRYSFVLGVDSSGKVVHNLQDPQAAYAPITSVQEAGDYLYFGSIVETAFARIKRPGATP